MIQVNFEARFDRLRISCISNAWVMHGQTGHGVPHPSQDADRRDKIVELHPVLCNDVDGYREQSGKVAC